MRLYDQPQRVTTPACCPSVCCDRDCCVDGRAYSGALPFHLLCVAQVNKSTSQVDVQVLNLKLDELELASLRGDLQEAALHVNFDTHMGRGAVNVTGPRYSGLQVRWSSNVA